MQKGFTLWLTGLPCSGKSSIADLLIKKLREKGLKVELLDGDLVRKKFTKDLGFTREDRFKNIERVAFVAELLTRNEIIVIASFVSPYNEIRELARKEISKFVLVYVNCPLEICIKRDKKGLYKLAIAGKIKNFTGISDPFEEPINPEIEVDTDKETVEDCVKKILDKLITMDYLHI